MRKDTLLVNSREKGKRGERMFARFLRRLGFRDAKRGIQYQGGPESPDVQCPSLGYLHFEVKFTESFRLHDALEQAQHDAGGDDTPVVAYKKKRKKWVAVLDMEDFIRLIEPRWNNVITKETKHGNPT